MSPKSKILVAFVTSIFSISLWAFRELEGLGWLDSFYFLIVTVSTVGFGDVTPNHPVTKFILILLIITGISTIALTSETVIDKLIQSRLENHYYLPDQPLDYSNHVIIVGYDHLVHNLTKYLTDRFLQIVIIYDDHDKVIEARNDGFEAYTAQSQSPDTLELISIGSAAGVFLFHEKDNLAIQTAIFAKQINPTINIFAKTINHLSIEYGQLVGIDRTYHRERLVASFISNTSRNYRTLMLPNQDVPESEFRILLTWDSEKFCKLNKNAYPVGFVDRNFSDLIALDIDGSKSEEATIHVVVMLKDEEFKEFETVEDTTSSRFERIFLTGYNAEIRHIIEHLSFEEANYWYMTFDEDEYEVAKNDGVNVIHCQREKLLEELPSKLTPKDLVVIMFPEITDSLVLSAVLMKLQNRPRILQLVDQNYEVDIYKKMGIDRVISPDVLIARGMFLILIKEMNLPISMVYRNSQMFEHKVKSGDLFDRKTVEQIKKAGYEVLLVKPKNEDRIIDKPSNLRITEGDNIMVFKQYETIKN